MALVIRLQRVGRKNDPHFRVVLTDSKNAPKSGGFIEILGWRDPKAHTYSIKKERIEYWMSVGAKPSDTVHNLLVEAKVINEAKKRKGKVVKSKEVPAAVQEVDRSSMKTAAVEPKTAETPEVPVT